MRNSAFWRNPRAVVIALCLVLALGGVSFAVAQKASSANNPAPTLKFAEPNEGPSRTGFAPVIKKVFPTVVRISSTKVVKTNLQSQQLDPFFRQFFGDQFGGQFQFPQEQRSEGLGSGVVMSPNGYIMTNNHVVDGATDIEVTLSDNRQFKGRVVGTDPRTDIAVVKIDADNLPAITVGNSDNVQVGDYALAIGNPFGVGQTVTMGIVSATHRSFDGENRIEEQEDFIQTDAAINPGNSGGALVNDRGDLIGINTAIIARGSDGNQGIGFAVPINMARNVMDQLIKNGKVTRAYLGIYPQDVTPALAKAFNKSQPGGALVSQVEPDTPASRAGLQKGDIILDVDGKPVTNANGLRNTISSLQPNARVNLKVLRNGTDQDIPVTLSELSTDQAQSVRPGGRRGGGNSSNILSGVSVEEMTAQTARQLNLPATTSGVVVTNVNPDSAAAQAGLQEGDVIQEVNRQPVRSISDYQRAMNSSSGATLLLVDRNGTTVFIAV
jgi:serine protease Do